jgi:hypothetical protein
LVIQALFGLNPLAVKQWLASKFGVAAAVAVAALLAVLVAVVVAVTTK